MALTNAERQKRWRAKNRVIYNLRRRNARKNQGSVVHAAHGSDESRVPNGGAAEAGYNPPPLSSTAPLFETKKVGEFRMLVLPEETQERPTMPVVKPKVFFNDHGAVISESVWNDLQEKKRIAKENGYEFDPQ